jgi:hypothetical protein
MFYYAGYIPTLAVEGLSKVAKQHSRWAEICSEVNSFRGHTSGVHTLLKDSTQKITDHIHDPAPNSHLRRGAHQLLSPHLNGRSRAHSLGGEKKHKKSMSSQVRDQKTIHNQWTRTIAIALNTLQRLYNCTRPNRTRTGRHRFQALPYSWSSSKCIVPSCVSESGTAPDVELMLQARGPSKLWDPSPALLGRSLLRRKIVYPYDHTDPPTCGVLSTTSLTPHPCPIQGGRFVQ